MFAFAPEFIFIVIVVVFNWTEMSVLGVFKMTLSIAWRIFAFLLLLVSCATNLV